MGVWRGCSCVGKKINLFFLLPFRRSLSFLNYLDVSALHRAIFNNLIQIFPVCELPSNKKEKDIIELIKNIEGNTNKFDNETQLTIRNRCIPLINNFLNFSFPNQINLKINDALKSVTSFKKETQISSLQGQTKATLLSCWIKKTTGKKLMTCYVTLTHIQSRKETH